MWGFKGRFTAKYDSKGFWLHIIQQNNHLQQLYFIVECDHGVWRRRGWKWGREGGGGEWKFPNTVSKAPVENWGAATEFYIDGNSSRYPWEWGWVAPKIPSVGVTPAQTPSGQCNSLFFANSSCKKALLEMKAVKPLQKSCCVTCPCVYSQILISVNTLEGGAVPCDKIHHVLGHKALKTHCFFSFMFYRASGQWISNSGFFP